MAILNPGEVVLPSVHVLLVLPRSNGPYTGQAAAIDPHSWSFVAIELPGKREERGNGIVQLLIESGVGPVGRNGDTVGRVGEGEVIHHAVADGLAEPADNNAAGLVPEFTNRTQVVIAPAKAAIRWPEHPRVISKAHHGPESLGQVDVATGIFFAPISGYTERLGEIVASTGVGVCRSRIGL